MLSLDILAGSPRKFGKQMIASPKTRFLNKRDNLKVVLRLPRRTSTTHLTCLLAALPIRLQLIALSAAAGDRSGTVPVTAVMQAATVLMLAVKHLCVKNNDQL